MTAAKTISRDRKTRDAKRQREKTAQLNDLKIPKIRDPIRRRDCEADDCDWLRTYLPGVFYNPFTSAQKRMIEDCSAVMRYGTKKCTADERGGGKSSIIKYLALKYALARQLRFPLIVAATHLKAHDTLHDIKRQLAQRQRSKLALDYPLETTVANYVDGWSSRARNVTANGGRAIGVKWGSDTIILPSWQDQEPLGPIIRALGITSDNLQGCNVFDVRPDFVMADDLDSRDSLTSVDGVVADKIEETLDKTIAGMAGQNRSLGIYILCTITGRKSMAFKYSDPQQKPAYNGERIRAIEVWPDRADLWQRYIELRQWGTQTHGEDGRAIDPLARKAHNFYIKNRRAMDRGAKLANPFNYNRAKAPDGKQLEVSSLQRCYNYIADHGLPSFMTEHQNDPADDTGLVESGITPQIVQRQVSGHLQGVVPEGCTVVVQGVDVGKYWFHWVARAFKPDGTGYTIDYGRQNVYGTKYKSEEGLDRAIRREVIRRIAEFQDASYSMHESLTLIDSGYRTEAVYQACKEAGLGVLPIKGIGTSAGVAETGRFNDVMRRTKDKIPVCDGVYFSIIREPGQQPLRLVCANADQWKAWEHDRWMTAMDKPGCMFLYGEASEQPEYMSNDQREHGQYAYHICAEIEVEEDYKGALRRRWKSKNKENHWLDASYYADVAAAILGIGVLRAAPKPPPPRRRKVSYLT